MKTPKIKFSEIKTAAELRAWVLNDSLSVGNRLTLIAKFLRTSGTPAERVAVHYTAHPGAHRVIR